MRWSAKIGRAVVGSIPRAEPFGLGRYGNFDPCGRGAARGQGHNHMPALGVVIDFGATSPTQALPLSVAAGLEEALTFGQGPHRRRGPLLSHMKRFARHCLRLLSASRRRPGAGGAIVDAQLTDPMSVRCSHVPPGRQDRSVLPSRSRPRETGRNPTDPANAGVSCLRRTHSASSSALSVSNC
jgi:hypothetical protein